METKEYQNVSHFCIRSMVKARWNCYVPENPKVSEGQILNFNHFQIRTSSAFTQIQSLNRAVCN